MRHDVRQVDQLRFYMSSVLQGYPGIEIEFICQQSSQPGSCRDSTPGPFRPTGLRISIRHAIVPASPEDAFITADLTVLRTQLADLCAIHTIVFAFHGYPTMRGILDRHPALREPLAGKERYEFACRRMYGTDLANGAIVGPWDRAHSTESRRRLEWVGVDPITLEATGIEWQDESDIVSELVRET
ncbi:hypothetical protein BDW22DRAFT_1349590 [Trametopsis cervina]|nr:hypothetical protein BDW22DRAFT_1349590 [Trametopsis cervina]